MFLRKMYTGTSKKLAPRQATRACARNPAFGSISLFSVMPVLLLALCSSMRGCHYPDDYVQFSKLSQEQQKTRFKQLPIDKQIDYYLYDQTHEPPRMGFEKDIASQEEAVLPDLLRRLKAEPEDYRRSDLIRVLEVMHRQFLPLHDNKEVIDTIEVVLGRIKDPVWRESSRKIASSH